MTASWLATNLDLQQIEGTGRTIASRQKNVEKMKKRTGIEVSLEIGGRYLLRYLHQGQVNEFLKGSTRPHWVTPTAIQTNDLVPWLSLYEPNIKRKYALILDPKELVHVCGPAWITNGQGIEYYLSDGFPEKAIVDVGVIVVR